MTRRLVLWRHGRTQWNVQGRVQGQTDTDLDDVGREQARSAAARLARLEPVRILSSDLRRARDTAGELSRLTGVDVEEDARLRELNFGEREGLTWAESWERLPEGMKAWMAGDESKIAGAETHAQAGARLSECVTEALHTLEDDQTLVVVAHGGVIRTGAATFLGFPEYTWRSFAGLSNCSWVAMEQIAPEHETRWRLTEWNAGTLPEPVLSDDER